MSALSIAAAYQLDQVAIPWPDWLRRAAARVGPQPGMLLVTLVFVVGALVAAIVPLREIQVLLYNTSSNLEVRLPRTRVRALDPRVPTWPPHPLANAGQAVRDPGLRT